MKRQLLCAVTLFCISTTAKSAEPAKTEVVFVINTAGSMQRAPDAQGGLASFAQCSASAAGAANGQHDISAMGLIQNVLAGAPRLPANEDSQRCIYDVLPTSDAEHAKALDLYNTEVPFLRRSLMPTGTEVITSTNEKGYVIAERACCRQSSNGRCTVWERCDDLAGSSSFESDGLLQQYASSYKFGLMTTDYDPSTEDSFGDDETEPSLSVAPQYTMQPVIAQFYADLRGQQVTNQPNFGAMPMLGNIPSVATGSLVSPHRGRLNNGRVVERAMVGESERQIRAHTDYMIRRIRGIKPSGFGAMSAQLRDYRKYLESSKQQGLLFDQRNGCRQKVVIILGESETASKAYYSLGCLGGDNGDAPNVCPPTEDYPYATIKTELEEISREPNLSVFYLAFGLTEATRQIYSDVLQGVGEAISLKNEDDLKRELSRILGSLEGNKRLTFRAPAIITPNAGDQIDDQVRQFRVTGYSTASAGGRYGRVEVSAFGCPSGGGQDPLGRLRSLPAFSYEFARKIALQTEISSFASHPEDDRSFGLNGTVEPSIVSPGEFGAQPNIDEDTLRQLLKRSETESLRSVYELLESYFGPAAFGASDDACTPLCGLPPDQKQRQLGTVEYGRFVTITPPRLNLSGDAYQAFQQSQRERPTLVATGAGDGKVHFFRIEDGYEVFNFIPNAALDDLSSGVEEPAKGGLSADGELVARNMIMCRSLGEGGADCPADPEQFEIRSLIAGGIGRSEGNLFGIDLTKVTEVLQSGRNNTISVDDVKTWDVVSGFTDPSETNIPRWDDEMELYLEER